MAVPPRFPQAVAQDSIFVPLLTYRTGPFAGSGIPIANGMHDYLDMLNERDGGIGGVKIVVEECETGYDTKKGVECYEAVKGKKPVVINPYSTGITLAADPEGGGRQDPGPVDGLWPLGLRGRQRLPVDLQSAGDLLGRPVDDHPATSAARKAASTSSRARPSATSIFDGGYGHEPIPLLEQFAKDYGFNVKKYPVPPAEMQNQSALWLNVRRDRPDWMIMWGWGAMNPTAVQGSRQDQLSDGSFHRHLVVRQRGRRAAGGRRQPRAICRSTSTRVGTNYPAIQDILKHVVDKGKSQTPKDKVGENFYNRGVYEFGDRSPRRSATRRRSPARKSSPARTCAAVWRR